MSGSERQSAAARPVPVFALACWGLGLVLLAQLWVAAMALSARVEAAREVRVVEKVVTKVVAVPAAARQDSGVLAVRPQAAVPKPATAPEPVPATHLPPPTPIKSPTVADPRAEKLLEEARRAKRDGDNVLAITKLEEAKQVSPDEAAVLFELGLLHEEMGVNDTAADYFSKVREMGSTAAGTLYLRASEKLRDGFQKESAAGKLSLGRALVFKNPAHPDGQQVVLTMPVEKAPDEEVDGNEMGLEVELFNRSKRDGIVRLRDPAWASTVWTTEPLDWTEGPETARVTYTIPRQDATTDHLFGELSYYGYVFTLRYRGQVVDMMASSRDLYAYSRQRAEPPDDAGSAGGTPNANLPPLPDDGTGLLPPP